MKTTSESDIEVVRGLLVGAERAELTALRERVARLESMLLAIEERTTTVGEVLVDAVSETGREPGELGRALQGDVEVALLASSRTDSSVLAEALYPIMGPAMRKMIANLFTLDNLRPGKTFRVEQVLLIERTSGVLLASSTDEDENSDVISGMLDAIRLFVQEAFGTPEHDGLQDLRVGDTSVLVEWGPQAVLASVVKGVPTQEYREHAAGLLERVHRSHDRELSAFAGDIAPFDDVSEELRTMDQIAASASSSRASAIWPILGLVVAVAIIVLVLTTVI